MAELPPSPLGPPSGDFVHPDVATEAGQDHVLNPVDAALATGYLEPDELPAPSGVALLVSYAAPEVVRQAKLEALELRVRQKMRERRADRPDPYQLRGPDPEPDAAELRAACLAAALPGGRDQIAELVVPPALGAHGELVAGSSELVLGGERLEYQCPFAEEASAAAAAAAAAAGGGRRHDRRHEAPAAASPVTTPRYRTADVTERLSAAAGLTARSTRRREPAAGATGGVGARQGQDAGQQQQQQGEGDPLAAQLSTGMLAFVAARAERPKGVVRTAFVPQAQALQEAQQEYLAAKARRPAAAPLRRQASRSPTRAAVAATAAGGEGRGSRRSGDSVDGGGQGGARGLGLGMEDVPMARAEETDLLEEHRRRSARLAAAVRSGALDRLGIAEAAPPSAAREPAGPRAARPVARSVSFSAPRGGPPAAEREGGAGRGEKGARGLEQRKPGGQASSGAGAAEEPGGFWAGHAVGAAAEAGHPAPATAFEDAAVRTRTGAGRRRQSAADVGLSQGGASMEKPGRRADLGPTGRSPLSPFMDRTAAAAALAAAGGSAGPRPPFTTAARRTAGSSGSSAAAPSAERPWVQPRGPSSSSSSSRPRSPSRSSAHYPASPSAHKSAVSSASSCAAEDHDAASPRSRYQPLDPEARRQRQSRPGSAIGTAKTNGRMRGLSAASAQGGTAGGPGGAGGALLAERSSASGSSAGGAAGVGGVAHGTDPWVTSASVSYTGAGGGAADRAQLQARILDGLARRHRAAAGDEEDDEDGPAAASIPEPSWAPPRRTARAASTPEATAAVAAAPPPPSHKARAAAAGHGAAAPPLAPQRSAGELGCGRPQSVPNRRARQPSYGSWAGSRPEAGHGPARLLGQHSSTGLVYDPEVQPSPLDSYLSRLGGLE